MSDSCPTGFRPTRDGKGCQRVRVPLSGGRYVKADLDLGTVRVELFKREDEVPEAKVTGEAAENRRRVPQRCPACEGEFSVPAAVAMEPGIEGSAVCPHCGTIVRTRHAKAPLADRVVEVRDPSPDRLDAMGVDLSEDPRQVAKWERERAACPECGEELEIPRYRLGDLEPPEDVLCRCGALLRPIPVKPRGADPIVSPLEKMNMTTRLYPHVNLEKQLDGHIHLRAGRIQKREETVEQAVSRWLFDTEEGAAAFSLHRLYKNARLEEILGNPQRREVFERLASIAGLTW